MRPYILILCALTPLLSPCKAMIYQLPFKSSYTGEANLNLVPRLDLSALSEEEQQRVQLEALENVALSDIDESAAAAAREFYGELPPNEAGTDLRNICLGARLFATLDPTGGIFNDPAAYYRRKGWPAPKGEKSQKSDYGTDFAKRFIAEAKRKYYARLEEEAARADEYWRKREEELANMPPPRQRKPAWRNWLDGAKDCAPVFPLLFIVGVYTFCDRERRRLANALRRVVDALKSACRRALRPVPTNDWAFWLMVIAVLFCLWCGLTTAMPWAHLGGPYGKQPFWVYRLTHWVVAISAAMAFLRLLREEKKTPARTLAALVLLLLYQPVCAVVSLDRDEWMWVNFATVILLPFAAWRKREEKA